MSGSNAERSEALPDPLPVREERRASERALQDGEEIPSGSYRAGGRRRQVRDLSLLEQVHTALGLASKLDDFYIIVASLLVDINALGFSRCFLMRYDERTRAFNGRLALGARDLDEHELFRSEQAQEDRVLRAQIADVQKDNPEALAVRSIYDLRYHGLWIQLLQGQTEGTSLNPDFQELTLRREDLPSGHIVERAATGSSALLCIDETCSLQHLDKFCSRPSIAGRLLTKRGLHGIVICDRAFDDSRLDDEALYHFQWLLNHASVTLENVELVEELTRTTQRLQEVDRLKTSFLSIVSHELRTPLTSIVGFVHLLSDEKVGPVNTTQRDLLRRVSQHSTHLQSMVNDLLEIAEVEAGGIINVDLKPVDPLGALLNVIPKMEARRAGRAMAITPVLNNGAPMIHGDQLALERIYFHLLDNALKFTSADGRVNVEFEEDGHGNLEITIADSGIGISQENLKRIFDHFYQVDFRLERAYGGMGIGLTVVKLLLGATGGKIRVDSTAGSGSRFTLTYPLARTAEEDAPTG